MRCSCLPIAILALGCSLKDAPTTADEPLGSATQPIFWSAQQRLLPETSGFAAFGVFVALDETTALVSDHWYGTDPKPQSGSVHVFSLAQGVWTRDQVLVPSSAAAFGFFGFGTALEADTAMIGAPGEAKGALYVWTRGSEGWLQVQKLLPQAAAVGDSFGESVALDGDLAIIGAPSDSALGPQVGAAYIYRRNNGTWVEEAKLVPETPLPGGTFGAAVAISGNTVVIGAPALSADPPTSGLAHVFTERNGGWVPVTVLQPAVSSPDDAFGRALAISSSEVVIGAPANGHGRKDAAGSVHGFSRAGRSLGSAGVVNCPTPEPGDECGHALALTDSQIVVGAPGMAGIGAAFFAQRGSAGFSDWQRLDASGAGPDDGIATSVALSGTACMLGSRDVLDGSAYAFALLGSECSDPAECANGICADGVCCNRACDGACEACNGAGTEGSCETVAPGTSTQACEAYVCAEDGSCKTSCESTADCAPGSVCDAAGRCRASPQPSDPDAAGCAIASPSRPGSSEPWLLIALALGWQMKHKRGSRPRGAPVKVVPPRARDVHARQHEPADLG